MLKIVFRYAVVIEEKALSVGERLFIQTFVHQTFIHQAFTHVD